MFALLDSSDVDVFTPLSFDQLVCYVQAHRKLTREQICKALDRLKLHGDPYLVVVREEECELVDGISLRNILAASPLAVVIDATDFEQENDTYRENARAIKRCILSATNSAA